MAKRNCVKTIEEVIEVYVKERPEFALSPQQYHNLMEVCKLVDMLDEEFDGGEMFAELRPEDGVWTVSIEVQDLFFDNGRSHPFFTYIKSANCVRIEQSKNQKLLITFFIDGLWSKK